MNRPNIYNFFKFIKNKTGQDLQNSDDKIKLKTIYSPGDLSSEEIEKLSKLSIRFNENLPKDFPGKLKIGEIKLEGPDITEIPTDLQNVHSLSINRATNITSIPPIKVYELSLWRTGIRELPEGLQVETLFIHEVPLEKIPRLEQQIRLLSITKAPISSLEGINARSIYLKGELPNLKELPDNLNVGLSLYITDDTAIRQLPKGLKVRWNLALLCEPQFDTLPDDLEVGNDIEVYTMPTKYPEHLKDKIKVTERKN